jgi:predicted amidohydrolase
MKLVFFIFALACSMHAVASQQSASEIDGWTLESPREEIRPNFSTDHKGSLIITHGDREGLDGWFQKTFPVKGGDFYRFEVQRRTSRIERARQSCLVRICWQDDSGKMVRIDQRPENTDPNLPMPSAEPEYPKDGATNAEGWTSVSGVYRSPSRATRAIVELHLQWAAGGRVEWHGATFVKTDPVVPRKVRLATIHHRPGGKSARENCEEYAPLIVEAGKRKADLVVLGETVPSAHVKAKPEDLAETIPGSSTEYFGRLAKDNHLHIVLSLYEREAHLIYNTAVLIGPEGQLIGKYRKVSLPPGEVAKGIAPGKDFPVFDTAIGKVGMMVCYDGFFPEVARELTKNGAEMIAWPVWGCNPKLAEARACENHTYVVSSTFADADSGWMISAIFDHGGTPIAKAAHWDSVAVAEVTLNQPYLGPYNLGDFRSMVERHRPPVAGDLNPTK